MTRRQGIIHAAQGRNKTPREIRSEEHQKYWSLWYPYASILTVIDIIWEVSRRVDFGRIRAPVMLVGSRIDPVINWGVTIDKYRALAGPKLCLTLEPRALENHVLCSRILSHDSVDEVVPVMIAWVQAKRTAPVYDPAVGLKE